MARMMRKASILSFSINHKLYRQDITKLTRQKKIVESSDTKFDIFLFFGKPHKSNLKIKNLNFLNFIIYSVLLLPLNK